MNNRHPRKRLWAWKKSVAQKRRNSKDETITHPEKGTDQTVEPVLPNTDTMRNLASFFRADTSTFPSRFMELGDGGAQARRYGI